MFTITPSHALLIAICILLMASVYAILQSFKQMFKIPFKQAPITISPATTTIRKTNTVGKHRWLLLFTVVSVLWLACMPSMTIAADDAYSQESLNINDINDIDGMDAATDDNKIQKTEQHKILLQQVILSDDYTQKYEHKRWTRIYRERTTANKEQSKLEKWLEKLFEWLRNDNDTTHDGDSSIIEILAVILKTVFILALVGLIVWLFRHADKLQAWIKQSPLFVKQGASIRNYQEAHLAQGWEQLPAHAEVPAVVNELLNNQQILPASSILYRASLRWLNQQEYLAIKPANTELQCVELIKQVQTAQANKILNVDSGQYVTELIYSWIPVAYSGSTVTATDANNKLSNQELAKWQKTLATLTQLWLQRLPESSNQHKGAAS